MNPIQEAQKKGLSYGEMARRMGVTRQHINLLALSKDNRALWKMSLEKAYKFKDILGIDIEEYLINSENK